MNWLAERALENEVNRVGRVKAEAARKAKMNRKPVMEKPPYPYKCGFDPRGVKLRDVVAHWRSCPHPRCQEMAASWEPLKQSLGAKNA